MCVPLRSGMQELCCEVCKHLYFCVWEQSICVLLERAFLKGRAGHACDPCTFLLLPVNNHVQQMEESLLADVVMALPISKYEPWHFYFPCPGLSLARCSEHWLLGVFSNDFSCRFISCTHAHTKLKLSGFYQIRWENAPQVIPLNLNCIITQLYRTLHVHSAEK